jgi:hypothetical protein
MIEYGIDPNPRPTVIAKVCDRCKTRHEDPMELQEFLSWSDTCGYGNFAFGDMTQVAIDLCQYCTKEVLGEWIRKSNWMDDDEVIEALENSHMEENPFIEGIKLFFEPITRIFKR